MLYTYERERPFTQILKNNRPNRGHLLDDSLLLLSISF